MKKLILGIVLGATLSSVTAAYATEIQTYLFPSHFYINGSITPVDPEYEVLNYNGHAYVPVRFITENMGGYIGYENNNNTNSITINYFPAGKEVLADSNNPQVRAGLINLFLDGDSTVIAGLLSIDVSSDPKDTLYSCYI